MAKVNNVIRLLDSRKIDYQVFELPEEKLGAQGTAAMLGVPAEIVFKTIVVTRKPGKPLLVVVPGSHEVNLKAVAKAVREKKVFLATHAEAEKLTRLQTGGISPLALLNKGFSVILDESAREHAVIHISGGVLGMNIRLGVDDLIRLVNASVAKVGTAE